MNVKNTTTPKVIVLRTAGTNCDEETAFAFKDFGAAVDLVHINRLFHGEAQLRDYHIMVLPGGFTYGDDIAAGRILANELTKRLGADICQFIGDGKLILSICNGFQVLVRCGILPGPLTDEESNAHDSSQKVTLTFNDSGKFEDRWTHLRLSGRSVWTEGLDDIIYIPVAHAQGKFVARDDDVLKRLQQNGQIVFRYCDKDGRPSAYPGNPNGSVDDIAGITDKTGRILGLMPHPERHFLFTQHPFWTRLHKNGRRGHGAKIFENGINYVKRNL